jgi:UDP-glucose 4-epimerase
LRHEPLHIHGDGGQTRDFIHVHDIAAANEFFAAQSPATGVFNLAHGRATSIRDLAQEICRLTGSHSEIRFGPQRAGDVRHSLAAVEKLRAAGFAPQENFADGLRETVEFFRRRAG